MLRARLGFSFEVLPGLVGARCLVRVRAPSVLSGPGAGLRAPEPGPMVRDAAPGRRDCRAACTTGQSTVDAVPIEHRPTPRTPDVRDRSVPILQRPLADRGPDAISVVRRE